MEVKENFSLKHLNTFHLDVQAGLFATVENDADVQQVIENKELRDAKKFILGGGSNILFTKDFEGLVIKNNFQGIRLEDEDASAYYVNSGAGVIWHSFVMHCIGNNYAGIENLSLIPGNVGAGPIQNIGAYGVELKDVFHSLTAIDLLTGQHNIFFHDDCRFGYRNSIFKNELKEKMIITSVTFRLSKRPVFNTSYGAIEQELERMQVKEKSIAAISQAVCNIRQSKLPDPDKLGNCGSFFKNPEVEKVLYDKLKSEFPGMVGYEIPRGKVKLSAGWMIEQCGWKGKRVGNTGAHKDQALVLVNYGGATGKEIETLSKEIQQSVKNKFGVDMEAEVNIL
jgi:UDP-N-acetylmuramate dehydrogenase